MVKDRSEGGECNVTTVDLSGTRSRFLCVSWDVFPCQYQRSCLNLLLIHPKHSFFIIVSICRVVYFLYRSLLLGTGCGTNAEVGTVVFERFQRGPFWSKPWFTSVMFEGFHGGPWLGLHGADRHQLSCSILVDAFLNSDRIKPLLHVSFNFGPLLFIVNPSTTQDHISTNFFLVIFCYSF